MSRPRQTTSIQWLKDVINNRIAAEDSLEARRALSYLLSDILMNANQYRGFYYRGGWVSGFWTENADGTQTWTEGQEDEYDHVYY